MVTELAWLLAAWAKLGARKAIGASNHPIMMLMEATTMRASRIANGLILFNRRPAVWRRGALD